MKLTGAQILWEALVREGVTDVFGYPGGAILPAYDAMLQYPIRHILVRHEQGATRGFCVGHIAPEASRGGPMAIVRDGDTIVIDVDQRKLDLEISEQAMAQRLAAWTCPPPRYTTGVFAKYVKLVSSASTGAVTG